MSPVGRAGNRWQVEHFKPRSGYAGAPPMLP